MKKMKMKKMDIKNLPFITIDMHDSILKKTPNAY